MHNEHELKDKINNLFEETLYGNEIMKEGLFDTINDDRLRINKKLEELELLRHSLYSK